MKIKGRKISGPNVEVIVIPRPDGDIVLKAQAILDHEPFRQLCPEPKPPKRIERGKGEVLNIEDPQYKKAIEWHNKARIDWLIITSLRATEDLEWETVDYAKPETWRNHEKELRESGFSEYELVRISNAVFAANGLDDTKIEQARERFLAGRQEEFLESSSPNGVQSSLQSGEPVNDSK